MDDSIVSYRLKFMISNRRKTDLTQKEMSNMEAAWDNLVYGYLNKHGMPKPVNKKNAEKFYNRFAKKVAKKDYWLEVEVTRIGNKFYRNLSGRDRKKN